MTVFPVAPEAVAGAAASMGTDPLTLATCSGSIEPRLRRPSSPACETVLGGAHRTFSGALSSFGLKMTIRSIRSPFVCRTSQPIVLLPPGKTESQRKWMNCLFG